MGSIRVAFIGDSYTKGTRRGGLWRWNYVSRIGRRHGWPVANLAVSGTGYVNPANSQPFEAQQLAGALAHQPDLVVVVGSQNDSWYPPEDVEAAAASLYAKVAARLVIVGPMWPDASPPERIVVTRDAVKAAAVAAGAEWVDPLEEGWLTDPTLVSPDGVHPNNAGHAHLAERIGAALTVSRSSRVS